MSGNDMQSQVRLLPKTKHRRRTLGGFTRKTGGQDWADGRLMSALMDSTLGLVRKMQNEALSIFSQYGHAAGSGENNQEREQLREIARQNASMPGAIMRMVLNVLDKNTMLRDSAIGGLLDGVRSITIIHDEKSHLRFYVAALAQIEIVREFRNANLVKKANDVARWIEGRLGDSECAPCAEEIRGRLKEALLVPTRSTLVMRAVREMAGNLVHRAPLREGKE